MRRILLVGNPNVGKSTLFNSLTKSSVHTGNFHGVTTDSTSKIVTIGGERVSITDLPGIYSLSGSNNEEKLTRDMLLDSDTNIVVLADILSLRRCMYLCMELDELGRDYILLINTKGKNKAQINTNLISSRLNHNVYLVNASREKLDNKYIFTNRQLASPSYLDKYLSAIGTSKETTLSLVGIHNSTCEKNTNYISSIYEELVQSRYNRLDNILSGAYTSTIVSGHSRLDKLLTNRLVMPILFFSVFIASIYVLFFLIGPAIGEAVLLVLNKVIFGPILDFLALTFGSPWLVEFVDNAVFGSISSVISFVPQVFLLFALLTILEDSGIITRLSYVLDGLLTHFGLNGKAIYTLLLGFGCNTMSSMASKNLNEQNMRSKCLIISPYISCMARLPIFVLIASLFFSAKSFLIIASLYMLGLVLALIISGILNKTIYPSRSEDIILEFPSLTLPSPIRVVKSALTSVMEFIYRIITIVLSVGVVVYLLTHIGFNLKYTSNITDSILYTLADKVSFLLAPIGLNSAGVITCLIVGVLAKELILTTMAIINGVGAAGLGTSIISSASLIHFTPASAMSMLVFSLLYSSCASNYAIMRRERGVVILSIITQLAVAYIVSFFAYKVMTIGLGYAIVVTLIIALIVFAIGYCIFRLSKNKCSLCNKCR